MMTDTVGPATALVDCTAYQIDILLAISDTTGKKGISIRRTLNDRYGSTTAARLYPNLDTLADAGLVEKTPADDDARANYYRLTDAGRRRVAAYVEYVNRRGGDV